MRSIISLHKRQTRTKLLAGVKFIHIFIRTAPVIMYKMRLSNDEDYLPKFLYFI